MDSSSVMMDPVQEQHRQAAIAICQAFLKRLSSLDDAMFNSLDDTDSDDNTAAIIFPLHFNSNAAYRTTFSLVVAHDFDPRSWCHHTILSRYIDLLANSASRDLFTLNHPVRPEYPEVVRRWVSWEAVEARWPFKLPVEASIGEELTRVCTAMWGLLRVVGAAALQEEARLGPCEFDVLAERGVVGRCGRGMVGNAGQVEDGGWVGARLMGWVRDSFTGGSKTKQD